MVQQQQQQKQKQPHHQPSKRYSDVYVGGTDCQMKQQRSVELLGDSEVKNWKCYPKRSSETFTTKYDTRCSQYYGATTSQQQRERMEQRKRESSRASIILLKSFLNATTTAAAIDTNLNQKESLLCDNLFASRNLTVSRSSGSFVGGNDNDDDGDDGWMKTNVSSESLGLLNFTHSSCSRDDDDNYSSSNNMKDLVEDDIRQHQVRVVADDGDDDDCRNKNDTCNNDSCYKCSSNSIHPPDGNVDTRIKKNGPNDDDNKEVVVIATKIDTSYSSSSLKSFTQHSSQVLLLSLSRVSQPMQEVKGICLKRNHSPTSVSLSHHHLSDDEGTATTTTSLSSTRSTSNTTSQNNDESSSSFLYLSNYLCSWQ